MTRKQSKHSLRMADWRDVDGGVVVSRYQAFCRCGWSMRFSTRSKESAEWRYKLHEEESEGKR